MNANTVMAGSAVIQAVGTLAAIWYAVKIAHDQQLMSANLRIRGEENAAAARAARAHVVAFRLMAILNDIRASLRRATENGTNFAQIERLLSTGGYELANRVLSIDGDWTDDLYRDFDVLPPELASTIAYLLYNVRQYNRSLEAQVKAGSADTQRLAAYLRDRHDAITIDLQRALALLLPLAEQRISVEPRATN